VAFGLALTAGDCCDGDSVARQITDPLAKASRRDGFIGVL